MWGRMQRALNFLPLGASDLETHPAFNVVIAYEDFETGNQAKRTYDCLTRNLGREYRLTNQMWKFDILSIPKLREIAGNDAAGADIVIVSCRGDELPEHVKAWMESWLPQGENVLALVGLFASRDPARRRNARVFLADLARRGKMQFFTNAEDPDAPLGPEESSALGSLPARRDRTFTTLAGVMQRDLGIPRWGINE